MSERLTSNNHGAHRSRHQLPAHGHIGTNRYIRIWESFLAGDFVLCVSTEILEEYEEVLARNISPRVAQYVMMILMERSNVCKVNLYYRFRLIAADPDDNKFVDCAITSNARYIVTEDRHFDALRQIDFPKVDVIGIDDFLEEMEKR